MNATYHIPVMLHESIEALDLQRGGTYVDATFGGGGHSAAILRRLGEKGRLIAFDKDSDALENAPEDPRLTLINHDYSWLKNFLRYLKVIPVDGILADLGISSHQVDTAERGFSFRYDAPLDMRMDQELERSAAEVVESATQDELQALFSKYGEVKNARTLAQELVEARQRQPIRTTGELVTAVQPAIHPKIPDRKYLAQVFQALRIEVNRELYHLEQFIQQASEVLAPGGRLAIITYHSLEDRPVKNFIRAGNFSGRVESDLYGQVEKPLQEVIKPITPKKKEVEVNPRSRSAKLRVAEKL